ncbi:MAG: HVO_0758 family zinc finger protein [Halobacteriaceae archaeon]
MDSVQKGLRAGDLEKDVYDRLRCAACEERLATENDPEEIGQIRRCPECGTAWQQLG